MALRKAQSASSAGGASGGSGDEPAVGGIAALRRVASAVLIDAIDPVGAGGQS